MNKLKEYNRNKEFEKTVAMMENVKVSLRPIKIFGEDLIDENSINQLKNCYGPKDIAVLTADAHYGYSHPIGGAVAYKEQISLSGVGFDIACGNKAVRTDIKISDVDVPKVMDEIFRRISFGVGRPNNEKVDHSVFDLIANSPFAPQRALVQLAKAQLGTVGSGNHFVDLMKDEEGNLWIANHFGSRGFGHKTAMGFIALSQGKKFGERCKEGGMDKPPILFDLKSELGKDYFAAMTVAGEYAYAGRDMVVNKVLEILGNPKVTYEVHNHHNFAWMEEHFGETYCVVRKGCTPARPGQSGFIGANMLDNSVIVEGVDTENAREGLYSTVHGAGRIISRNAATGKKKWEKGADGKKRPRVLTPEDENYVEPQINWKKVQTNLRSKIELRGAGGDEAPECYKKLNEVLEAQGDTIRIKHVLTPVGVAMAGENEYDPYKD